LQISDDQIRRITDRVANRHNRYHQAAAGLLYVDQEGRVLLVRPTYKPYWEIPGGEVEPGESPRDAARREVREELGCDVLPVGDLLVVDFLPPRDGRPPAMR